MFSYSAWIARNLARAFLADAHQHGATQIRALHARATATLGESPLGLLALVQEVSLQLAWQHMDSAMLGQAIMDLPNFASLMGTVPPPRIRCMILRPAHMYRRPAALQHCALPDFSDLNDIALWLNLPPERLLWLCHSAQNYRQTSAQVHSHYHYQLRPKRQGGLRLLEIPKPDLKRIQHQLLHGLLQHVPAHEAAHGFVSGRSVTSHAALHTGQAVVVRFDLKDFFPSIGAARIRALWQTLGYPQAVARILTALCTTRTAPAVIERLQDDGGLHWSGAKRLTAPHLPQGAPSSPALANLCAFGLDVRLHALAATFDATYSRYADDLVFSGPIALHKSYRALQGLVKDIAQDEGFALHPGKTRCMPQHRQQRITGIVVNEQLNLPRTDYDRLRACLHQCILHGPASQNHHGVVDFQSHLRSAIAWVGQLNPARESKLLRMFEKIQWSS